MDVENNNTHEIESYALITGASQGFGKQLAEEIAERGINVLLVSLPDEGLPSYCKDLEARYKIKAAYFETDLREQASVYRTAEWALKNFRVNILVNNAGIGGSLPFNEASVELLESMIHVNIRVVTLLTRLLLDQLKSCESAYILNVASMASFSPMAFKTIYPASKAFIHSFSKSLNQELKGTGVTVSAIYPGPMKTNAEVTGRIENQSYIARLGLISPRKVAKVAISGLFNQQSQIVPGLYNKFFWLLMKIVPLNLRLSVISDIMRNEAKLNGAPKLGKITKDEPISS